MSVTITDPDLLARLTAGDWVDVKDTAGKTVGRFHAEYPGRLPPGCPSPFSDAELADLRQERDGRPLADILRDSEARG